MYEFRNIEGVGFEELAMTWNLAFSDYVVPVDMTPEKLEAYFKVTGVVPAMSYGAYYTGAKGELVGLLINAVDEYKGSLSAYDAMTGIVPEHRGKGLFSELFEFTRSSLKKEGVTNYYLEVITSNEKALAIYRKKGGEIVREYSLFSGKMTTEEGMAAPEMTVVNTQELVEPNFSGDARPGTPNVCAVSLSEFLGSLYTSIGFSGDSESGTGTSFQSGLSNAVQGGELAIYDPSFGCRLVSLRRNIENYKVVMAETDEGKSAAVFSSDGTVKQILYRSPEDKLSSLDKLALRAVFSYLSQNCESLRMINIPSTEKALIDELLVIGLTPWVKQYEMLIRL